MRKQVAWTCGIVAALVLVAAIAFLYHPLSEPRANERVVVNMLSRLIVERNECCVTAVSAPSGLRLVPNVPQHVRGYTIVLTQCEKSFEVHADPEKRGSTGFRSFFTDETGIVRSTPRGQVTKESPAVETAVRRSRL